MDTATDRYDVVLLVEQELTSQDARLVRDLHAGLDDQEVVYHLLLPMSDAAAAVEASMTAIGSGDMVIPAPTIASADIAAFREECRNDAQKALDASLGALTAAGAEPGSGTVVEGPPLEALSTKVEEVDGREVIILTRPHLVAEFFHVDWTSRARRHLGVPVLHLLEHSAD